MMMDTRRESMDGTGPRGQACRTGAARAGVALAALLALAGVACAQNEQSTALTIYSRAQPGAVPAQLYRPIPGMGVNPQAYLQVPGYAVVKQERTIQLAQGRSTIRFTDVAAHLDPTTVAFKSLTDPDGTRVLEQDYRFDLVGRDRLLQRYIDQPITVEQTRGDGTVSYTGTLLSTFGGLILKTDLGIVTLNTYSNILFRELPGGLMTRPTLVWDVVAQKGGPHRTRVTSQTEGITWWADYNLVFAEGKDANHGTLDVGAWVSILNKSGGSYPDARLKLIAGDVQRAPRQSPGPRMAGRMVEYEEQDAAGFEEKSFFEFHLYTLGRATTIPDNSTKQMELFAPASGVPTQKVLVYEGLPPGYRGFSSKPRTDRDWGTQSNTKVDVYLRFKNDTEHGLGVPLPAGRVRVSKVDEADGSLEFIGEDVIDHTPRDETVRIRLGSAFDVVGERTQTDFKVDTFRRSMSESIRIKIRNHKDQPVDVVVRENPYRWTNWTITESSDKYEKKDSRTIEFPVTVDPDAERTITYTVRYTW